MNPVETAILRTLIYGDIFNFPMSPEEIHHFLIADEPYSLADIQRALNDPSFTSGQLEIYQGYVVCAGRRTLIEQRLTREKASQQLWPMAMKYGAWLSRLPFVRMVAITGALAMRNSPDEHDDLDFLLVTESSRVWLARAFAIIVVRLVKIRGVVICPNYVLAESALEQNRKDLFIAHEIAQMIPIYGHALYREFRTTNSWVDSHLPNAHTSFYVAQEYTAGNAWSLVKGFLEMLLGGKLGNALERWEYRRKLRRFSPDLYNPHADAQLDEQHVKGHFKDYGHPVLREYHRRLRDYELEGISVGAPGD